MGKKAIVAGCVALGLALAGCGQTTSGEASKAFDNAQQLALAAKSETAASKSAKFTFEANMLGMEMTGNGEGTFDGANTAMSMNMNMFGQQIEMRMVDGVMYMKMPAGMIPGGSDKPWLKMDSAEAMPGADQMAEQNDPSRMLEMLNKAGTITKSEQTQLEGQPVTHYSANLELGKLADQLPGGITASQLEQIQQAGITKIPMELWLYQNNLPAKVTMDMSEMMRTVSEKMGQQLPGEPKMTMSLTYRDWGSKVDVQAPPADQVGEMPAGMMGPGGAGAGAGAGGAGGMPGFGMPN